MRSGGCTAGSGRALRLDPFALPVCYVTGDMAADGRVREIELHPQRVVIRRTLAGMPMAINLPVSVFTGVGLRMMSGEVAIVLAHRDPGLVVPLFHSSTGDDVVADWRSWGAALGLPLLVEDETGWRRAFARPGSVRMERPRPRRRRRSVLKNRRPRILLRRVCGMLTAATTVHRGEREIIARN